MSKRYAVLPLRVLRYLCVRRARRVQIGPADVGLLDLQSAGQIRESHGERNCRAWSSFSVASTVVELHVLVGAPHGLDGMLSDRAKLRLPSSPSTTRDLCKKSNCLLPARVLPLRIGSRAPACRQLSTTAAAGDGSGFLIAGGVGVAAIACMAPRADEGHAAAPALPADEASKKLLAVLSHGEELAKIAKEGDDAGQHRDPEVRGVGNQPERNRSDAVAKTRVDGDPSLIHHTDFEYFCYA